MKRTWIKLWVDQTLRGSMLEELNPEQRWIFIGLLLMAGDSSIPGVIFGRKNERGELIGRPTMVIADTLAVKSGTLLQALDRLKEVNKVRVSELGVIWVENWRKYQSEYQRQKPYRSHESYKQSCHQSNDIDREGEGEGEEEGEVFDPEAPLLPFTDWMEKFLNAWNALAVRNGLAQVSRIVEGSSRAKAIKARYKDKGFDYEKVFEATRGQSFLFGAKRSPEDTMAWRMTFDWILKPANYIKVLEGQYRDLPRAPKVGEAPKREWTEEERKGWRSSAEKEIRKTAKSEEEVLLGLREWDRVHPPSRTEGNKKV
jgi:hypothetical protein